MNGVELVGLVMPQDVILITIIILLFIGLISVPVHWLILGKRALDRGRVRVESVGSNGSYEEHEGMI